MAKKRKANGLSCGSEIGGGTVMVWDRGTYYVYGEQPLKSLREGKLHLLLDGKKAKGEWTLVRIRDRWRHSDGLGSRHLLCLRRATPKITTGREAAPSSRWQKSERRMDSRADPRSVAAQ